MSNYFTLTRNGSDKPAAFTLIDEEICQHFGAPVDDDRYFMEWYNTIGLGLAIGKTWEQLEEIFKNSPTTLKIISFLRNNYTADAWYQHK